MPSEQEPRQDLPLSLELASPESLLTTAYYRKLILDANTLEKIVLVLQRRMETIDSESPELEDTEVALRQVYAMFLELTEDVPKPGEALKQLR